MSDPRLLGFETAIVALFGLVIGSFLNVLVHRLPRGESVVWPGSRCPACGNALRWFDNLPVVSWIALAGRCRFCKKPISLRYPLVELLAGAILVQVWLEFGASITDFLAFGAYALALLALFWTDYEEFLLPNAITYPGIAGGLLYSFWNPRVTPLGSFLGALSGYAFLWALAAGYRRLRGEEGMGGGDFKLAAMIGAFSGVEGLLQVMLIASLGGSLLGMALIAIRRGTFKSMLPFGCFLAPAALAIVLLDVSVLWQRWQEFLGRTLWGQP